MTRRGPALRSILRINGRLLFAAILTFGAWWLWSNATVAWWGLWLVAVFYALGALVTFLSALGDIRRVIERDREIDAFERQGPAPQSDRLASDRELREQGLIK